MSRNCFCRPEDYGKDCVTMSPGAIIVVVALLAGSLLMAGLVEET